MINYAKKYKNKRVEYVYTQYFEGCEPKPKSNFICLLSILWNHYENMPIQIYRKFYHPKMKIFR